MNNLSQKNFFNSLLPVPGKIFLAIQAAVVLILAFSAHALADQIPRKILAFRDTAIYPDLYQDPIHVSAEVILNHLGMEVIYHPLDGPLPTEGEMAGVRGILTWFQRRDPVADPARYCTWMTAQMSRGRHVVILGEPGVIKDYKKKMIPECLKMFETLGAEYLGSYADNPFYFRVVKKVPAMVEFERPIDLTEGFLYTQVRLRDPKGRAYLVMGRRDLADSDSDMVFTTPRGAFAHPTTVMYQVSDINKKHWRVNPFLFFEEGFGIKGLPRPDVTTINGRRIFFSQIDGDGIVNLSHIDRESFAGEVILEKVLKRYPDLPVTASIITGYLDQREYTGPRVMNLYKSILALPNVEPASHGYAHPLEWRKKKVALRIPGYRFSAEKEILGSVALLRDLLKSLGVDKKVPHIQWTGDSALSEEELVLADQGGLLNINGGNTLFDAAHDSYSFLSPIGIRLGNHRQIYAAAANENVYTHLWEGPYYGFSRVIETFENTGHPIRIKPIDLYYHYYSGERTAALKALQSVYDYALSQEIFPIWTSDYAGLARDFFEVTLSPLPGGGFRVSNAGRVRTIRFDREPQNVDLDRSRGVIGFRHLQGSLYVFLDRADTHDIFLTGARPSRPYLAEASFEVKDFNGTRERFAFAKRGWGKSEGVLGGMAPRRRYRIRVGDGVTAAQSDARGYLKIVFPGSEGDGPFVRVDLELH